MTTVSIPAGQTLTVTADAFSSGRVYRMAQPGGAVVNESVAVAAGTSVDLGPFTVEVVKPVEVCGVQREKGWSGKVLRHQVRAQLKHGMVREV